MKTDKIYDNHLIYSHLGWRWACMGFQSSYRHIKPSGELSAQRAYGSWLNFNVMKIFSPTEAERCIESLIAISKSMLDRVIPIADFHREFLNVIKTELTAFTKNQKDPGVLDHMMKKLDLSRDGQLAFQTFLNLIGVIGTACYESFIIAGHSHQQICGTWPPSLYLFFQLPNLHLFFMAHTYPEPSAPTMPWRLLLLVVIKQYSFKN